MNCDEQYLPGALAAVVEFFRTHPQIDVLFGDIIFVNGQGAYIGHRKVQPPLLYHTWTCHLSTLSCATFFRRRVVFADGEFFDPRLRDSGDGEWMVRLLRRRVRMAALGRFTSVFAFTGGNMSQGENARREARGTASHGAAVGALRKTVHHRASPAAAAGGRPVFSTTFQLCALHAEQPGPTGVARSASTDDSRQVVIRGTSGLSLKTGCR